MSNKPTARSSRHEERLRDRGSLNATNVNGKKCGGRKSGESPEEGAKHQYPMVELNDGDKITVSQTDLAISIEKGAAQPEIQAGLKPGELSELWPDQLFQLVFGGGKKLPADRRVPVRVSGKARNMPEGNDFAVLHPCPPVLRGENSSGPVDGFPPEPYKMI